MQRRPLTAPAHCPYATRTRGGTIDQRGIATRRREFCSKDRIFIASPRKNRRMRFARAVFLVAGVWGIVVLTPLYFLVDLTGRRYAAPMDYPQFFYGFLSVAMAWQIAFLVIGSNPSRFRAFMIPGMIEKLGYVGTLASL